MSTVINTVDVSANDVVARLLRYGTYRDASVIPCLIGPTGCGKTTRAENYAKALGLELVKILPGTSLPEDILGLPKVIEKKGGHPISVWSLPDWAKVAIERPSLIFIDELDKAREECIAALLTLIASREVRGVKLHKDTLLLAAMQPVVPEEFISSETGKALAARLVFIPVKYDLSYIENKHLLTFDLGDIIEPCENIKVPVLPEVSTRQLDYFFWVANNALNGEPITSNEKLEAVMGFVRTVANGMFRGNIAEALVTRLFDRIKIMDASYVKEMVNHNPTILKDIPQDIILEILEELFSEPCTNDEEIARKVGVYTLEIERRGNDFRCALYEYMRKKYPEGTEITKIVENAEYSEGAFAFALSVRNIFVARLEMTDHYSKFDESSLGVFVEAFNAANEGARNIMIYVAAYAEATYGLVSEFLSAIDENKIYIISPEISTKLECKDALLEAIEKAKEWMNS